MRLTEKQVNQIPELIMAGKRTSEIAKMFGCTVRSIQWWATRWHKQGKLPKPIPGRKPITLKA